MCREFASFATFKFYKLTLYKRRIPHGIFSALYIRILCVNIHTNCGFCITAKISTTFYVLNYIFANSFIVNYYYNVTRYQK